MVISMDDDDTATRDSNNNHDVVLKHYTPTRPPPLPEPPPICDIETTINDPHRWLHSGTSIDGQSTEDNTTTIDGEFILLFRSAYQVNRMYQVSVLSSIVLLLQLGLINTIAIMQLVVLYQESLNMISSATQNGEYNAEEYYCYADIMGKNGYYYNIRCNDGDCCNDTMRTNGEKIACCSSQDPYMIQYCTNTIAINTTLRVGHSIGDTANEGMFQEPIPVMCLCYLLIVTLGLLGQSMGGVKIHKDQVNRVSQMMRARLEAQLESIHTGLVNRTSESNNKSFGSFERTPKSCIQSDVFVCSFLPKLVCSSLLKLVSSFLLMEPQRVPRSLKPRLLYTKMY
jgi:hypothetical protein